MVGLFLSCQYIHTHAKGNSNSVKRFNGEIIVNLIALYLTNKIMRKADLFCKLC